VTAHTLNNKITADRVFSNLKPDDVVGQAYYMLYNNKSGSLSNSEVSQYALVLLNEPIKMRYPINLRIERILDHDNISRSIYQSLLYILPIEAFLDNSNGICYRYLNHACMNDDIYDQFFWAATIVGKTESFIELTEHYIAFARKNEEQLKHLKEKERYSTLLITWSNGLERNRSKYSL
jgi:hypothetical protein